MPTTCAPCPANSNAVLFIEADYLTPVRAAEKADNKFNDQTPWRNAFTFSDSGVSLAHSERIAWNGLNSHRFLPPSGCCTPVIRALGLTRSRFNSSDPLPKPK